MNNLRQVHTDESLQCTSMPQPALSLSTQFPLQQRAIRRYKPVPVYLYLYACIDAHYL
jgi:hypothetical protein